MPVGLVGARRQRRAAVGGAVLHVDLVDELVNHHVVAMFGRTARGGHVLPTQRDRAAVHGFAQQRFLVGMHHAGWVGADAPGQHRARMHDDAGEIVIPVQPQVQHRQASLCGDGDGHFIGHLQLVRASELLAV